MKHTLAIALTAALALTAFEAGAATKRQARKSQMVELADLNLDRAEGAATAYARLHRAAKDVCKPSVDRYFYQAWAGYKSCVDATLTNAIEQVDSRAFREYVANKMERASRDS